MFLPLAATLTPMATAVAAKKPNIIFIVTDDQHFNTMKCWGGDVYTPNIDRLANEGAMFERAYTASSISSPSRYSLLSGRYASRCEGKQFMERFPRMTPHRIDNTTPTLESNLPNLPRLLKEGGYTTGMVGKWHTGTHMEGNGTKREVAWEKSGLEYYDPNGDPTDPKIKASLQHNHDWYSEQIKAQGFDYADNIYWANLKEIYLNALNFHNIDWSVKGAIDFMQGAGDKPFFLYFSTSLHHGPTPQRSLPEEYERVTSKGIADEKMGVLPDRETLFTRLKEQGIDEKQAYTLWLDDAVGALMAELERSGEAENTIIFYISDHGIDQKSSMYEGGIHVPFMVWGKDFVKGGTKVDKLIHSCDMARTALDVAGVTPPKEAKMDGQSLLPLLDNGDIKWRTSLFTEVGYARCVVSEQYKYIAVRYPAPLQAKYERGFTEEEQKKIGYINNQGLCALGKKNANYFTTDQLYDLEADPMEQNNLFDNPDYKAIQKQMTQLMRGYLAKFPGRPFYDLYDGRSKVSIDEFTTITK